MSDYDSVLYSRGYIFSNQECQVPSHYQKINISTYYFYHDKNTESFVYKDVNGNWVLVYGIMLDTINSCGNLEEISKKLLSKIQRSKKDYLNYLDMIGGRYIVIINNNSKLEVYNDACGNKTVNYILTNRNICLSSHLELIGDNINLDLSGVEKERNKLEKNFRYGYPGMSTPYKDVKKLIPNTSIELLTNRIERYFPRENLDSISIDSAFKDIKKLFNTQFDILKDTGYIPLISLTAGWDSRFTVSVLDNLDGAKYFTYRSFEAHDIDVSISKVLAKRLDMNHTILYNNDYTFKGDYTRYNNFINKNTYLQHGRKISYMYYHSFKNDNYVHIRSNLSEIGRFFYGKCKDYCLNELSLLFLWGSINKEFVSSQIIRNSFREFFIKNKYNQIYNYNAFDLFYWEHRMGQWNSEVLIEGDSAFETIQLFNCRAVLKNLLALSENDRKNDSIYKYAIFEKGKSELIDVPLNPDKIDLDSFLGR